MSTITTVETTTMSDWYNEMLEKEEMDSYAWDLRTEHYNETGLSWGVEGKDEEDEQRVKLPEEFSIVDTACQHYFESDDRESNFKYFIDKVYDDEGSFAFFTCNNVSVEEPEDDSLRIFLDKWNCMGKSEEAKFELRVKRDYEDQLEASIVQWTDDESGPRVVSKFIFNEEGFDYDSFIRSFSSQTCHCSNFHYF